MGGGGVWHIKKMGGGKVTFVGLEQGLREGEKLPEVTNSDKSEVKPSGSLRPRPSLGCRVDLPPEEGPPYRPEFYSGWEPPAMDPQGRAWEDPVEKQLQHERRRQQVRLKLKLAQVTWG